MALPYIHNIRCSHVHISVTGNNAVEMETTAIYDKATKEWIVNSPSILSQKYWITNGAVHAKHCVVFARVIVDGTDHGIHGVLVRIRDNGLKTMPGKLVTVF